ncbi:hypothetical protein [Amycolatopsis sp. NBRC 101858]|uniref:hypothetical protein n=1 Tax=Amycolatopsis sp. NBRC 101858 TaxID=3032200 RepID=UPI002554DBF9|nr:hypothetical protein [Amycolatopsis sp. NBRC 101858]
MDPVRTPISRGALVLLRAGAAASAALACLQPVLAGAFLQGYYSMLAAHRMSGMLFALALVPTLLAALVVWRGGRGPGRPALFAALALVLCAAQIVLGFTRDLAVHVPLGAVLLYLVVRILMLSWAKQPVARYAGAPA